MNYNSTKFLGIMLFWLSIYGLLAFPNGMPWEQYIPALLMALASAVFLALEKEGRKHG